jgi:hypothetical protein
MQYYINHYLTIFSSKDIHASYQYNMRIDY